MCGRFALIVSGEAIAEQFALADTPLLAARYNIAPTQPVAAVRLAPHTHQRELTHFHWGLIPSWAKDTKMSARMINARSESVTDKPSFRNAFKRRRCLIPASGFYEWQRQGKQKQPMFIEAQDGGLLALAGLWETWHGPDGGEIESCTILTTEPNELMASIHNRMPVIVEPADYDLWLHPGERSEDGLHLLRPYPPHKMRVHPVSTYVNNARNEGQQCIQPLN